MNKDNTSHVINLLRTPPIDEEEEFTTEEIYRLALESIKRWTQREGSFSDVLIINAIGEVVRVALGEDLL